VGEGQLRPVQEDVAVEQDVDVQRAGAEPRPGAAAGLVLQRLGQGEQRLGGERGAAEGGGVQEIRLGDRRDGGGAVERGDAERPQGGFEPPEGPGQRMLDRAGLAARFPREIPGEVAAQGQRDDDRL